jgi:hypothetical protein
MNFVLGLAEQDRVANLEGLMPPPPFDQFGVWLKDTEQALGGRDRFAGRSPPGLRNHTQRGQLQRAMSPSKLADSGAGTRS